MKPHQVRRTSQPAPRWPHRGDSARLLPCPAALPAWCTRSSGPLSHGAERARAVRLCECAAAAVARGSWQGMRRAGPGGCCRVTADERDHAALLDLVTVNVVHPGYGMAPVSIVSPLTGGPALRPIMGYSGGWLIQ